MADIITGYFESILRVELNRPIKRNAMTSSMYVALAEILNESAKDERARVVLWHGAGDAFCAGNDLEDFLKNPPGPGESPQARLMNALIDFDKPLIAAVNGVAAGAGMSMALACDMRVGSTAARFKTVFVERNLSPDSGMSYFLPRIVGYSRAADLVFSSRAVNAEEAYRIGLLDRLVAPENLLDEAVALALEMSQWPPLAVRMAKRVLQHNQDADFEPALRYESVALGFARKATADTRESIAAFAEKRKGVYTGA